MSKGNGKVLRNIIHKKFMNSDNKNNFFAVSIDIPLLTNITGNFAVKDYIDQEFDMILSGMGATPTVCRFEKIDNSKIVYFFSTKARKRRGQLIRLCNKYLPGYECNSDAITKTIFFSSIEKYKKYPDYKSFLDANITSYYKGEDIKLFDDPNNWRDWQKELYGMIFHKGGTFKKPDPRKIILLFDPEGNTGKSSFFKWLYFRHSTDIGRITYGSTGQLRSSVKNIGAKKLYLVDLPRSKGKVDSEEDLLSVLEEVKSGILTNNFRGDGSTLLMEPPHVIVSGNYILNQELLSADRWDSYQIKKPSMKLKNITKSLKIKTKAVKSSGSLPESG